MHDLSSRYVKKKKNSEALCIQVPLNHWHQNPALDSKSFLESSSADMKGDFCGILIF